MVVADAQPWPYYAKVPYAAWPDEEMYYNSNLWNKGDRTPEEIELGFSFVDETLPEIKDESYI